MAGSREFDRRGFYRIRVSGSLDGKWSDWFDGFAIAPQAGGETLLAGPVADQATLYGVLNRLRDLGLPLLSVIQVEADDADLG